MTVGFMLKLEKEFFLMVCQESETQSYNRLLNVEKLRARLLPGHPVVLEKETLHQYKHLDYCEPDDWQVRCMAWGMLNTDPKPTRLGFLDVNIRTWQAMEKAQRAAGRVKQVEDLL
jgi:hypothetical protein